MIFTAAVKRGALGAPLEATLAPSLVATRPPTTPAPSGFSGTVQYMAPEQFEGDAEVSTAPTDDPSTALSPDGTQIAFVANQDRVPVLWVRSLDAIENRALPGTEGASLPFWSPDGRTIGFFAGNKLKRIDVAGGMPLVVVDAPNARGGAWNADGVILFAPGVNAPIMRVPARGGVAETVTQVNTGSGPAHRLPQSTVSAASPRPTSC